MTYYQHKIISIYSFLNEGMMKSNCNTLHSSITSSFQTDLFHFYFEHLRDRDHTFMYVLVCISHVMYRIGAYDRASRTTIIRINR